MIFPRNKPVPVQYVIDTSRWPQPVMQTLPKGMFANIEKQYAALDIGCPAVAAANNKLFDVPSPFSLDLTFGLDESGDSYWRYEFDTKVHPQKFSAKGGLKEVLAEVLTQTSNGNSIQTQMALPYALVTDEEDTSLMALPPHGIKYENCAFVTGEYVFTDWIRHIASAWILLDQSKPAVVHFEVGKPCMSLCFNKQVDLSYVEMSQAVHDYESQMFGATSYRNNSVGSILETVKSRRPKKLLVK